MLNNNLNFKLVYVTIFYTYKYSAFSIARNLSNLYPFEQPMHAVNYPTAIRFLIHVNILLACFQADIDPNCNVAHNCKLRIFLYSCCDRYILHCL